MENNTTYSYPSPYPAHIGELTLPDGNYEGELNNTMRHGLGVFIWSNGDAYFGSWLDDKMHGKGIFCYNTGHYIEGNFNANFVDGPACLTYPDKSFTKGILRRGELNGRVLSYQTEKHSWTLQDFDGGRLKGIYYEGKGKPVTYDFFVNTYGEDFGGHSKKGDTSNASYAIQSVKRTLVGPFSIGCFELEEGVRHFGIIKSNKIQGLGIRVLKKGIEVGKYRDDCLDGAGRRLEFGSTIYEGEFLQGRYYGEGTLCQWRGTNITFVTGVFTSGILMHKVKEESISLASLNEASRTHASPLKVIKIDVRNYEDTFIKNYTEPKSEEEDSKTIAATIKEIAYAKVVSRETVIEYHEMPKGSQQTSLPSESLQNSPSRRALMETASHLAKMVNAVNNDPYDVTTTLQASQGYIDRLKRRLDDQEHLRNKPKRSHSSERNLEPSFSQVFSIGVDEKPSTQHTYRSASRDTARYGNISINYPTHQVVVDSQVREGTHRNFTMDKNREIPSARETYQPSPSVNQWYAQEPSIGLNISSNGFGGVTPSEKVDSRYNFGTESISPLLSGTRRETEHDYQEQPKTLVKGQKNSKSSSDLHVPIVTENDSGKVVKTLTFTGVRDSSPARRVPLTVNTKKLTSQSSINSVQSVASTSKLSKKSVEPVKMASKNFNTASTPTKGNKAQTGIHRANSPGQVLNRTNSASKLKTTTPLPKNPTSKEKSIASTSRKPPQAESPSLIYVGSSSYIKKATPASAMLPKSRDSSRLCKQNNLLAEKIASDPYKSNSSAHHTIQDTRRLTSNTDELTARKSARARGHSPAQVVELDLHPFSTAAKPLNERREAEKEGYLISEKSQASASTNIWSAQKQSYLREEHSYAATDDTGFQGSALKSLNPERLSAGKQSARSKSPLLSNVVNIDISMFRTVDADGQKSATSPIKMKEVQDHSPISHTGNKSSFMSSGLDQELSHLVDGYRTSEKATFMPAKEILGTFVKKREESSNSFRAYGLENKLDTQASRNKEIIRANLLPVDNGSRGNTVDTYARHDTAFTEGDTERLQVDTIEAEMKKHKATPGHNVNTPSFSQKNFKFTTGEPPKSNYDTPKKGGRYEESSIDVKSQHNHSNHSPHSPQKCSEYEIVSSPAGSPSKNNTQKQKLMMLVKSPARSPSRAQESPSKKTQEHDSLDCAPGYYPIKKTCELKTDSYYCESLGSSKGSPHKSCSQKGSPQKSCSYKGSPSKQNKNLLTNQSDVTSPEKSKVSPYQFNMTESNNSNIKIVTNPGEGVNQYPETFSIALSTNRGDTPYGLTRGLKEVDDSCKLDFQALPTLSSKYENLRDDGSEHIPLTASTAKVIEASPEQKRVGSQSNSQASSKATSTAYFGFKSGPTTPQIDFDIMGNYLMLANKHPVEESHDINNHGAAEYFTLQQQQENFANRIGVKRPKLVLESKIPVGLVNSHHGDNHSVNMSDYMSKPMVENPQSRSPTKQREVQVAFRGTTTDKGQLSARSSIQEEWGTAKDVNNLCSTQLGTEPNTITKYAFAPQGQHTLSHKLPDHTRIGLTSHGYRGEGEQLFGSTIGVLRPPTEMSRSRSANKFLNRTRDSHRTDAANISGSFIEEEAISRKVNQSSGHKVVYDRYRIADEDDISEEKNGNLRYDLMSQKKMETKRASAENDFSGASVKRRK